jgi:hypothetical protein
LYGPLTIATLAAADKTDSGADCALFRPLPTNPDGSPLSEAKYREEIEQRNKAAKKDLKAK